ncbi:MAG: thiolase domain-containing protein [Aigarchaeota archaeon]|nr:thiolase domain-containing protein [Candidatus Pelearchaeum maunauluense]
MKKVLIAGYGLTKVEEHWDRSLENLMAESSLKALEYAGLSRVDAVYVANVYGEVLQEQAVLGSVLAEELGMSGVQAYRIEAGAASGIAAVKMAANAIQSGEANVVLVTGVEKLSDGTAEEHLALTAMEEREEYTGQMGVHQAASAALLYRLYLSRYGARQDGIAQFAVISHENAVGVSHAQYPFKVGLDTVMKSPYLSEPLHRLEATAVADGSAAIILCSEDFAAKLDPPKARLAACSLATDYVTPFDREDPLHFQALARATHSALEMAGVSREQIGFLELHDSFSIVAALSLESSGFFPRGKAGEAALAGKLSLNGELPINTFGGLKARGHPVGATAIYQLAEAYLQLTHQAGKNQLDNAKHAMVQSLAGLGCAAAVCILEEA